MEGLEKLQKEHAHQAELNGKLKTDNAAAQEKASALAQEKAAAARKARSFPFSDSLGAGGEAGGAAG